MNIIIALILFSLIIVFHEFGHFTAARLCGVKVLEFSLGMGPCILSRQGKETKYSVRLLPIGGYCSMLGEDTDEAAGQEGSFSDMPLFKRFVIVFAGPFFNFILAFFCAAYVLSQAGVDRPVVRTVLDGYPAAEAGIEAGDVLTSIDGNRVVFFRDISTYLAMAPGKTVDVTVLRGSTPAGDRVSLPERTGQEMTFRVTPLYNEEHGGYMLGVTSSGRALTDGPASLLYYSVEEVRINITTTLKGLLQLIRGAVSPESITGPVGIVSTIGETVDETKQYGIGVVILNLVNMALLLSANLGVMNLLPLPALDGGRLIIFIFEGLFRREMDKRVEGWIHFAGLIFLLMLMSVVMAKDVIRLFG